MDEHTKQLVELLRAELLRQAQELARQAKERLARDERRQQAADRRHTNRRGLGDRRRP